MSIHTPNPALVMEDLKSLQAEVAELRNRNKSLNKIYEALWRYECMTATNGKEYHLSAALLAMKRHYNNTKPKECEPFLLFGGGAIKSDTDRMVLVPADEA